MTAPEPKPQAPRTARKSLLHRLRPFVRRDLRTRLASAAAAVAMLVGLAWLGVSALTRMDTQGAQALRVELGMEPVHAVCGGPSQPACSYEDREQARADEAFALDRAVRLAVLGELSMRVERQRQNVERGQRILSDREIDFTNNLQFGGDRELAELLANVSDLRPLATREDEILELTRIEQAAWFDALVDRDATDTRDRLLRALQARHEVLDGFDARIRRHLHRDGAAELDPTTIDRERLVAQVGALRTAPGLDATTLREWVQNAGGLGSTHAALAELVEDDAAAVAQAIAQRDALVWQGGFAVPSRELVTIVPPSVRYASPIEDAQRWRLMGTALFGLAAVFLLVLSPIVTATTTAREREAGTLPVLRMTGLSAGDLALAMIVGPNVFAWTAGIALLAAGALPLLFTAGPLALATAGGLLAVLAVATHLSAIGLGDALGQRVNALVVGALLGVAIVGPGLVGSVMAMFDVAATGLLLGPLPAVMESTARLTGLPDAGLRAAGAHLGGTMLAYALFSQGLLALICLGTWRRRVEQAWAPLFRPREGVALALVSIGCSALSLLDLSHRSNAQDFDALNLVTFLSTAFLLPVLGWLLVASLRRPARASAVADHVEARAAFARFQALVVVCTALVGCTYWLIMRDTGLIAEDSEVMWATLAQILLVAETGVATLLWTSRRREGRHRIAALGGAVVLLQIALGIGVYGLEVEHVARTNTAANPMLVGMEVSPYWMAFLLLMWAAGLAIVGAALLAGRKTADVDEHKLADQLDDDAQDEDEAPGRRLIH